MGIQISFQYPHQFSYSLKRGNWHFGELAISTKVEHDYAVQQYPFSFNAKQKYFVSYTVAIPASQPCLCGIKVAVVGQIWLTGHNFLTLEYSNANKQTTITITMYMNITNIMVNKRKPMQENTHYVIAVI